MNINRFSYDEIFAGQIETFSVAVTEEMQASFLVTTGDINPIHSDESYAKGRGFKGRLVYGMLTASFYSTLVGTLLPGEKCLFHETEIKFRKPVLIGDILTITGECIEKNDTFKLLTIKAKIRNQNQELVSSAKLKVGVLDE